MSRTGKRAIPAVSGVTVSIEGNVVKAKGPKGEQSVTLSDLVSVEQTDHGIVVKPANDTDEANAHWGTARALIANVITGVKDGFQKKLAIQGVGYRASMQGKDLKLLLGFSHEVVYQTPPGITVSGIDKQAVGQAAANIREYRKPEPYQGKGVRYVGEYIARKEGKKK